MLVCPLPFFQRPSDVPDTEKQNVLIRWHTHTHTMSKLNQLVMPGGRYHRFRRICFVVHDRTTENPGDKLAAGR